MCLKVDVLAAAISELQKIPNVCSSAVMTNNSVGIFNQLNNQPGCRLKRFSCALLQPGDAQRRAAQPQLHQTLEERRSAATDQDFRVGENCSRTQTPAGRTGEHARLLGACLSPVCRLLVAFRLQNKLLTKKLNVNVDDCLQNRFRTRHQRQNILFF